MFFIKNRVEIWYFLYICVGVTGVTLPSWQKTKILLPRKNTPKGGIFCITEKDDIHPKKYGISSEIPHLLTPYEGPKT